jgi:fructuronate reductase
MRLSNAALADLPPSVAAPRYDRSTVTPGIVHLGVGGFHRAHQAAYVDDCLAAGETGWGICGASLRSPDTRDALAPQDSLYTLSIRDSGSERLRIIGSIMELLVAPESPSRLLDRLTDPRIRIVSLTITEKGYAVDLGSGGLRLEDPDIRHDLETPHAPRSALGFMAEAIDLRRKAGAPPLTLLSCDNLPQNGATLARVLGEFAAARDPELAAFIAGEIACPSAMVDRIVPVTTDGDRREVGAALGVEDRWPVMTEPFTQWVIEDRFASGRPMLERHGVEFVRAVEPFEHMKLRLLNGAHSALAAIGRLCGLETVADAVEHPILRRFIARYWTAVIPTLATPEADARAYTARLLERFGNRALRHRTAQIASDASQKIPQRIVAPLRELLAAGRPAAPLVLALAAWIRSCGVDDRGAALTLNDPTFEAWGGQPDQRQAEPAEVVRSFLTLSSVFGTDLPRQAAFVTALEEDVAAIAQRGSLAVVEDLLREDGR